MNRRIFVMYGRLAGAALLVSAAARAGDDREDKEKMKHPIDNLMMFSIAVTDMPKAKAFYADKLGLKVTTDSRRDDHNWWVGLALPEGGPSVILTTAHENMKPGTMKVYFATADVAGAHQELSVKGAKVNEVKNDLFGPGSGVKWFSVEDPDGNQVLLVQPPGK
ncbi:MAG: glyoxalase superfamily protein [Bryobacteraceae bacterium]|jgi:catechol 2,3-dioxygenase-like lactoylglutathione lyase family enzyme